MTNANDKAPRILDVPIGLDAAGMRREFDSLGDVEVSDTTVRDPGIRRTVLAHALLSYLFGVVIVGVP
jgi:hypothetical protein